MNAAKAVEKKRERNSEEQVLAEIRSVLEFAEQFFRARNKIILANNISCQLKYFSAAEAYEALEEQEELKAAEKVN